MRDAETAQTGLRAALTGHMVLSTLHTRDAASAPIRLLDMGVPAYMVASSLEAVIAQRLVRLICESCTQDYEPTAQERAWLTPQLSAETLGAARFRLGMGCGHCNGTGKRGRLAVYEMLEFSQPLADAVARQDTAAFAHAAAGAVAGNTLVSRALELALHGRITISEVMRISQAED